MAKRTSTTETDAKRRDDTLGLWIAIGAGFGLALDALFGRIGLGIALGAAFGIIIGSALASRGDGRRADRRDPDALPRRRGTTPGRRRAAFPPAASRAPAATRILSRQRRPFPRVGLLRRIRLHVRRGVRVDVKGDAHVRVTEAFLHDFGMYALTQKHGGVGGRQVAG